MFEPIMPAAPTMVSFSFVTKSIVVILLKPQIRPLKPASRAGRLLDLPAVHQRVGDRQFVDILQFVAETDTARDRRNFSAPGSCRMAVHQVEKRRLPSTEVEMARITSFTPPRAMPLRTAGRSSGPRARCPASGEMTPPSTWYIPWYWRVFSTTARRRPAPRRRSSHGPVPLSAQIGHTSSSERLLHSATVADRRCGTGRCSPSFSATELPLHAQDVDGQAQRRAASHARKLRQVRRRRPV